MRADHFLVIGVWRSPSLLVSSLILLLVLSSPALEKGNGEANGKGEEGEAGMRNHLRSCIYMTVQCTRLYNIQRV